MFYAEPGKEGSRLVTLLLTRGSLYFEKEEAYESTADRIQH